MNQYMKDCISELIKCARLQGFKSIPADVWADGDVYLFCHDLEYEEYVLEAVTTKDKGEC